MSDKHEARVEVLTAEVRVLQIGSGQATLKMVRQLDWADPAEVEPFGRVRTGDKPPGRVRAYGISGSSQVKSAKAVEIIGSASGVLVRSVSWRTVLTCTSSGDGACPEIRAIKAQIERRKVGRLPHGPRESGPLPDELTAHEVHDWTRYDPDQQTYEEWQALPLIVLAGLR